MNNITATQWTTNLSSLVDVRSTLAAWLSCPDSLTQRLTELNGTPINVDVLRQEQNYPTDAERQLLNLDAGLPAHVREVVLLGGASAWVFARSVIPGHSMDGSFSFINELGNKPLGHWLFTTPDVKRFDFEFCCIPSKAPAQSRWGRRSRFEFKGQQILVAEYFLPSLIKRLSDDQFS